MPHVDLMSLTTVGRVLPGLRFCPGGEVRCFKAWDLTGKKWQWCIKLGEHCEIIKVTGTPPPPDTIIREVSADTLSLKQGEKMRHGRHCPSTCECKEGTPFIVTPGPDGQPSTVRVQPAPGDGRGLCNGVAGNFVDLEAGATLVITITVDQYSWLRPQYMTINALDLAAAAGTASADFTPGIRVLSVQAVGRQVIGSSTGISGQSIAAASDNALHFGRDIPPVTSANGIAVTVRNDTLTDLRVNADVEGLASQ